MIATSDDSLVILEEGLTYRDNCIGCMKKPQSYAVFWLIYGGCFLTGYYIGISYRQ
jgi:hypothetical protein